MTRPSRHKRRRDPCNLPHCHKHLHLFDELEISPCQRFVDKDQTHIMVTENPAKADFWSVYGHYNPALCDGFGGVDCLEDFASERQARAFARRLVKKDPHLSADNAREIKS